jgi:hypothetical protein
MHANLALLAALIQSTAAYAGTYTVKEGDTLSQIAGRELSRPIYGAKGSLQKILERNQEIKDPNRIHPGQVIRLSDDTTAEQSAASTLDQDVPLTSEAPVSPATSEISAPASAPAETARYGWRLGLGLSKDELDGVGHGRSFRTTQDSGLQTRIDLDAYYKPTADSRIGLSLGIKNGDFADSNDGRFAGRTRALAKLSAFGALTLADRWHLGLELGTEQSFFLVQTSNTTFTLEEVFVDFATASAGYDVLVQDSWRWSLLAEGSFHLAAEAAGKDVERGSSYRLGTQLSYFWDNGYRLEGGLHYGRRNQGVSDTRQKLIERAAEIAVGYEF